MNQALLRSALQWIADQESQQEQQAKDSVTAGRLVRKHSKHTSVLAVRHKLRRHTTHQIVLCVTITFQQLRQPAAVSMTTVSQNAKDAFKQLATAEQLTS